MIANAGYSSHESINRLVPFNTQEQSSANTIAVQQTNTTTSHHHYRHHSNNYIMSGRQGRGGGRGGARGAHGEFREDAGYSCLCVVLCCVEFVRQRTRLF